VLNHHAFILYIVFDVGGTAWLPAAVMMGEADVSEEEEADEVGDSGGEVDEGWEGDSLRALE
jgi:hypothetical protein